MVLAAIVLFCVAAVFGLSLAIIGVRYKRGSLALGLGHATIAVLALALLGGHIFTSRIDMLYDNAALLFVLALGGGVVLLALREGRKPPPGVVVGIHGAMAFVAIILLVVGYVKN